MRIKIYKDFQRSDPTWVWAIVNNDTRSWSWFRENELDSGHAASQGEALRAAAWVWRRL